MSSWTARLTRRKSMPRCLTWMSLLLMTMGRLVLNVVNRHRDQPIEVEIQSQKGNFSGAFEVAEVNGPDIKAENTFGSTKVQTSQENDQRQRRPF